MIRLTRPTIPAALAAATKQATQDLWESWGHGEELKFNAAIYNHASVKQALRGAQFNKCAYCETLNPTSHDVVEHFRPKNGWRQVRVDQLRQPEYFWLAYDWENLLFACDQCNDRGHKQNLFPLQKPHYRANVADQNIKRETPLLLNPYGRKDPEKHIDWNRDVPRPRNGSRYGKETIATFKLDENSLLLRARRTYLDDMETLLTPIAALPVGDARRIAARSVFIRKMGDAEPWTAMIRANFGDRIRAL